MRTPRQESGGAIPLWIAGTSLPEEWLAPDVLHLRRAAMSANRITRVTLDESTILKRSAEIEQERAVAMRDLEADNSVTPLRAVDRGQHGPWSLHLAVAGNALKMAVCDRDGADAETIGLGLARFRRDVRDYFAICDSYYRAARTGSRVPTRTAARPCSTSAKCASWRAYASA